MIKRKHNYWFKCDNLKAYVIIGLFIVARILSGLHIGYRFLQVGLK